MGATERRLDKKDLVLCCLLVAFCLFLFKDIIIGGHLLFGSDFVAFYLGLKQFLYNEIYLHHSIPFWNPYIFGGIPFWAHFESTIFYPLHILFWIVSPETAYGPTMFIHLVLAGVFMYMLCRSLRISRSGSFVAAAVFSFNGFIMATIYTGQMFRVQGYSWMPLVICFLNRALTSRTPYFSATMAGLVWGLQILAGSAQDALYTFLTALLFLLYSLRDKLWEIRFGARIVSIACFLFVIGSGIAAIQLVPAFEFIGKSVRTALDHYDLVTLGSYPPEGIVTAVMPHFFGNYAKGNFWVSGVPWSVPQYNLYVGILPIILLFFISYRRSDNTKVVTLAATLAIVAFVLALGSHTPVYKLAYLLPGFDRIRAPAKIIFVWVFALALLAGKGMDDLFSQSKTALCRRAGLLLGIVILLLVLDGIFHADGSIVLKFFSPFMLDEAIPKRMVDASNIICGEFHRFTLFGAFILLPILLWMRGALSAKLVAAFLCALLLTDLGYASRGAVQYDDKVYRWMAQTKRSLDMSIGKDESMYRVGSDPFGLGPNLEMYLGYQTVGGYTPLILHRFYEYINHYCKGQLPEGWVTFSYCYQEDNILMDLLNVKYQISHAARECTVRKTYLPRAFVVSDYKVLKKEEILDSLVRPDFDPSHLVLLEKEPGSIRKYHSQEPQKSGGVEIKSYRPDHIVIVTDSSTPGYLFLSEIFYPGWKAFVDGQSTRILQGNYLFRVIELPEGRHEVHLVFEPLSIKIGVGITLLTLFLVMAVVVRHFGKRTCFLRRG